MCSGCVAPEHGLISDHETCSVDCNHGYWYSGGACVGCSVCDDGVNVALSACGATEDTVCSSCVGVANGVIDDYETCTVTCETGYWFYGGVCHECTGCGGEAVIAECTGTSDTLCSNCGVVENGVVVNGTTCAVECLSGYWYGGGACQECTACGDEAVIAECTGTLDTVCTNCGTLDNGYLVSWDPCVFGCENGYYFGAGVCWACTECGNAGAVSACSGTTDTVCRDPCDEIDHGYLVDFVMCLYACDAGYFAEDATTCVACGVCGGGTFAVGGCNGTHDVVCSTCVDQANADVWEVGDGTCGVACHSGYFLNESAGAYGECVGCSSCASGHALLGGCSGSDDTLCSACMDLPNADVWEGADGMCNVVCHSGYYWEDPGCSACSSCDDVVTLSACNATDDTVCSTCINIAFGGVSNHEPCEYFCSSGYYLSLASGDPECVACSGCAAGFATLGGCVGDMDTECANCITIVGAVVVEDVEGACVYACLDGYYVDDTNTCSACSECDLYVSECGGSMDAVCNPCGEFEVVDVGDDGSIECNFPATCQGYHDLGDVGIGLRMVATPSQGQVQVYCDNVNDGGGWMLVRCWCKVCLFKMM